jgi:hypothetical protein
MGKAVHVVWVRQCSKAVHVVWVRQYLEGKHDVPGRLCQGAAVLVIMLVCMHMYRYFV